VEKTNKKEMLVTDETVWTLMDMGLQREIKQKQSSTKGTELLGQ
jgi:hypothetical protein